MNQSVLGSIRNSFQILGAKMKNKIKDALDFYGRPVVDYAQAIRGLFNECYFIEQWIKELLLTSPQIRTDEDKILLQKLSRVSKFL